MNEIIPWIEKTWESWALANDYQVQKIFVEEAGLKLTSHSLLSSDLVVITSFTTTLARYFQIAKVQLGYDGRTIVYLHNQASIACWPYFEWGLGSGLTENDFFVGSCLRDKLALEKSLINAQIKIHPFSFDEYSLEVPPLKKNSTAHFVFIGRISPQKNLHTALWAFSLLKTKHPEISWKFELFGKEDHLGSPLMGIENNNYLDFLLALTQELGLTEEVIFRGFVDRQKIQKEMSTHQCIFLAPSLHSDENFGMAAFRCLSLGHQAVLSNWGGHSDYETYFPQQLTLVPVSKSKNGPFVDVSDLVHGLHMACLTGSEVKHKNPDYYLDSTIKKSFSEMAFAPKKSSSLLQRTSFAQAIHLQWRHYFTEEKKTKTAEELKGGRIFESFEDPTSWPLFEAYGMNQDFKSASKTENLQLAPWVKIIEGKYRVLDPMKGEKNYSLDQNLEELGLAVNPSSLT